MLTGERGTAAILVAAAMVLLMGLAAIAVDAGAGFNNRRQDQTAADLAALAGGVSASRGGEAVRDDVLDFVRRNLQLQYSDAEYRSIWEQCVDPASVRNNGGFDFVAVPAPTGWAVVDPSNWCISFESGRGLLRVRVPDQLLETEFARVVGVTHLTTSAFAVARVQFIGEDGILPFGLPAGAGEGGHLCLSSGPTGLALDPCAGPTAGNFGTLKGRIFGSPQGTNANCNASPLGQVLAINIAAGYDHTVFVDPDGSPLNEVRDECFNPFVDTLNTDTGFPGNGVEEGLTGPVPSGLTPRLQQYGLQIPIVNGTQVNHAALWSYLRPQTTGGPGEPDYQGLTGDPTDDAPASCDPSGFSGASGEWQRMQACLEAYATSGSSVVIFDSGLGDNIARFAYVPQFHESSLGPGNQWLHIARFRAIYLQSTAWKKGNLWEIHHPGETYAGPTTGGYAMKQLTAFVIPDDALPEALRGDSLPGTSTINPYVVDLFR